MMMVLHRRSKKPESLFPILPLLIICAIIRPVGTIENATDAVKNLIEKALDVLVVCSEKVPDERKNRKAFLDCTAEEEAKNLGVFPQELFEVLHDSLAASLGDDDAKAFWTDLNLKGAEKRAKEIDKLGKGNINGIAYLVKDNDPNAIIKQPVLKVVLSAGKNKKHREIEVHKELEAQDWSKIKLVDQNGNEKIIAASGPFLPHLIFDDKTPKETGHMFDFVVMERLGITVQEWLELKTNDKRRPTKDELLRVLSRTYSILTAIHSAGFRHGDSHKGNWALSRTNTTRLYLFDFGLSHKLVDFSWMATDLYRWAQLADVFADWLPETDAQPEKDPRMESGALKKSLKALNGKLMVELRKILWFHPDRNTRNAPFQELSAKTYKEALENIIGFKEFRKIAEDFMGVKDSGLETSKELYHWQPKAGERRKRGLDANDRFLLVVEQVRKTSTKSQ